MGRNPEDAPLEELHHQAWEVVAPCFRRNQEAALAAYLGSAGSGRRRTADSIIEILPAVCHGRVESLFIPAGVSLWGRFDPDTGEVSLAAEPGSGTEDLVNLAAIYTHLQKGAVYSVRPDQVPGSGDVAAVLLINYAPPAWQQAGGALCNAGVQPRWQEARESGRVYAGSRVLSRW